MKSSTIQDQQDPSFGTFINHDEMQDSSETEELIIDDDSKKQRRRSRIKSPFLPSFVIQSKLITRRSSLLALSLTLTLLVFWLLDSLKDAVLEIMVDGNLKKHQPLAKMASVGSTLFIVMLMEYISHEKKKERKRQALIARPDDEVLHGGGVWTKMSIGSELEGMNNIHADREVDTDADYIPISIFYIVGISYIAAFSIISFSLARHRRFSGINKNALEDNLEEDDHTLWYIVGYIQYITIESYGSIGVATFWSFANTILNLESAKMFYGFIIACAQLGAIGGSSLATIPGIGIPNLFLLACLGILLQIMVMYIYDKYFPSKIISQSTAALTENMEYNNCDETTHYLTRPSQNINKLDSDADGLRSFLSGVYLILRYNYLILILGVSCLYEVSLTCLDYEMKLIGLEKFREPAEFTEDSSLAFDKTNTKFKNFMGRYGQLTNLLSLLLSYFIFPYLMKTHGLKNTLLIFPSLLVIVTVTTFVALPLNLPVLFVSMSLLKALTYSVNDPAKEILYIPTSNSVKFKAKFWIDVVGARIAKAIGSSINTYAGTAERIVTYGSLPSVVTAITLWVVCFSAGMEFDKLVLSGQIVGSEDDDDIEISSRHCLEEEDDDDSIISSTYTNESNDALWESNTSIELVSHSK